MCVAENIFFLHRVVQADGESRGGVCQYEWCEYVIVHNQFTQMFGGGGGELGVSEARFSVERGICCFAFTTVAHKYDIVQY